MSITVKNVNKYFGAFRALTDVSVEVPSGELVALLGPSGSGKTTLLRIIGGLETADTGELFFEGAETSETAARERNVGFVFQHYALFRHMTIYENVAFPLRIRKRPKDEIREQVTKLLKLIQLEGVEKRYPSQLSGGQRQRVALARALAARPKVLLLDEPFGALDAQVRKDLRRWLRQLHQEIHITSILVTHDQEEALEVADRVIIMNKGRVEQVGSPDQVYNHPANPFVISFLGHVNVFHGRVLDGEATLPDGTTASVNGVTPHMAEGSGVATYVRPHEIDLVKGESGGPGTVATVLWVHRAGATVKVELRVNGSEEVLVAELTRDRYAQLGLVAGETVTVVPRQGRVFEGDFQI